MSSLMMLLSPTQEAPGYQFDFDTLHHQDSAFPAGEPYDFDFGAMGREDDEVAPKAAGAAAAAHMPDAATPFLPPAPAAPALPYQPKRISPPRDMVRPLAAGELEKLYSSQYNLLRTGQAANAAFSLPKPIPAPVREPPEPSTSMTTTTTTLAPAAPPLQRTLSANSNLPDKPNVPTPALPRPPKRARIEAPRHNPDFHVAEDSRQVGRHYNMRPNISREDRNDSPIIGLKNFNNWIKTVLINQYCVNPIERRSYPQGPKRKGNKLLTNVIGGPRLKVLDLGCGKGGDLNKWGKVGTAEYVGIDVAEKSVEQAIERYENSANAREYQARFFVLDCFSNPLESILKPQDLERKFDVVSMQFCMHYAFKSPANARTMLQNVSKHLRYGGMFLGTIPDAELLFQQLDDVPPEVDPPAFGNSRYKVTFEQRQPRPDYGMAYRFWLQDAVDDVPEYIVKWELFEALAAEHGLQLVYTSTFGDLFFTAKEDPEFQTLMKRMRVVDEMGQSQLDEEMWDAANLYVCFAFTKA